MTDPTSPTLDEAEDRLRRTLAARAEDMAPGDASGEPPDLRADAHAARRRRLHPARRPLRAAAAVIVVALAAGGGALVARDAGGDGDDAERVATVGDQPAGDDLVAAVTAPRALVAALQGERELAAMTLVGFDDVLRLPVMDTGQARADTDEAAAAFEAFVTASPDGAAYRPALDTLGSLDELRADVDADAGPRTLDNTAAAQAVFDRYAGLVRGLLDAQATFAGTIGDPDAHAGAVAYSQGLRLDEHTAQLRRATLLAQILPGDETVGELSRAHTEVQRGLDSLVADTTGTAYGEAAATAVSEIEDAGLLEATGAGLTGSADLAAVITATDVSELEIWPAYLDRVERVLATGS